MHWLAVAGGLRGTAHAEIFFTHFPRGVAPRWKNSMRVGNCTPIYCKPLTSQKVTKVVLKVTFICYLTISSYTGSCLPVWLSDASATLGSTHPVSKGAIRIVRRQLVRETRMKKLAIAFACPALLTVASTGAWGNAISQVTLSKTSNSIGSVVLADNGGTLSFWFSGTAAKCGAGRAGCVSRIGLLDPNNDLGTYWLWIVGSHPTLSATGGGDYPVNPGNYSIHLEVYLNNGNKFFATLALTDLIGGNVSTPEF